MRPSTDDHRFPRSNVTSTDSRYRHHAPEINREKHSWCREYSQRVVTNNIAPKAIGDVESEHAELGAAIALDIELF